MKRCVSIALFLVCLSPLACGGGQTLIKTNPTVAEQDQARTAAARALDDASAGLDILNEIRLRINETTLSTAAKDELGCTVLKVLGTPQAPSPATTKACGVLPESAKAPFHVALEEVRAVLTCASLRTSVAALLKLIDPLIEKLAASKQTALSMGAFALQATFKVSRSLLGGQACSS